jgi:S-formylglutathione hydrolase FrmB
MAHPGERLMRPRLSLGLAVLGCLALAARADEPRPLEFHLAFDKTVSAGPFTGRVYVLLSRKEMKQLPAGPNWFKPEPFFALDVKDWKPGETRVVGAAALAYPEPLGKLAKGEWTVTAVMDLDRGARSFSHGDGNGYSKPLRVKCDAGAGGPVKLTLDQVYRPTPFKETERVKLVDIESKLLSAFHGRPVRLRAGVVLPKSYAQDRDRRYPVIYEIPGFSGTHFMAHAALARNATEVDGVEILHVMLDPECRLGHHVFADSDNNGPCGRALVEELIPHIERTFRGLGTPAARFVTGHSSGGWSSLWLQVAYPGFFGGCWSTAPDPVDFRDFQKVNLYEPGADLFTDAQGKPRPLARKGDKVLIWYKPFSDMEVVMGRGGQLFSFEAVFSPKGPGGAPRPLWDRATGKVDAGVAKSWERYDIRLVLERNWKTLGPKLRGKLHVYMGSADNFYLEGATLLLKQSLARLGSDAVIELFPGRDHGTLMDTALRRRIGREMAEQFRGRNPNAESRNPRQIRIPNTQ